MDRDWIIPATAIVGAEYCAALLIGARVGFAYSIPLGAYLIVALTVSAASLTGLLLFRVAALAFTGAPGPIARLAGEARAHRGRLSAFVAGVVLVGLQMGVLTWLKVMLPIVSPFWADGALANLDKRIFGTDPWRISMAALGWATGLIDRVYVTWAPVKLATLFALFCTPPSAMKSRAMLSYFAIVAAVALGQYAVSSAGPIFTPGFEDLPIQPWAEAAREYLLADYRKGGGHIGTGISAMPSLHVAIALWVALVGTAYFPRLQIICWTYFGLIAVGSVHLGWHYSTDAIAGALVTLVAWYAMGRWRAARPGPADERNEVANSVA